MTNLDSNNNHHAAAETNTVSAVILDLDGTLLNTESLLTDVLRDYLASYGKVMITDIEHARVGKTQEVSAKAIVEDYDLPLTPDQYIAEINPLYHARWKDANALPGANRLIKHLHKYQVPFALASNSIRANIDRKISLQEGWKQCFSAILGCDEVRSGKPSPDLFLEAAKRMSVDSSNCLVIEDSLVGVKAAKAAGMKVVAVPSPTEVDDAALADSTLNSLLEFQPNLWGLPPFDDWVDKALPVDPIFLEGQLVDEFLVELPGKAETDGWENVLPHQVCGIFFGWAKSDFTKDIKVVVSIRHEVSSTSKIKLQLCSLGESSDRLSESVQLVLVGYIRGFSKKGTLNTELNEDDKSIALSSLELSEFW